MVTPKPHVPPISTVPELRAALLAGMMTGDPGKALRYDVITYVLGQRAWTVFAKAVTGIDNKMNTNERCKLVFEYLNKRYPPGVNDV